MNWSRFSKPCDDRSDEERAEFNERLVEYRAERARESQIEREQDTKTGSDIDKFLDKHPAAEFND